MSHLHQYLLPGIVSVLDAHQCTSVCDYGCGDASLLAELLRQRPDVHYTGIDFLSRFGEIPTAPGITLIDRESADYTVLLDQGGTFDLVISTFALHHFQYPVRELRQLCAMVKPGGLLLLFDHHHDLSSRAGIAKAVMSLVGETMHALKGRYHRHHYTLDEALDLFSTLPVEIVESADEHFPLSTAETTENAAEMLAHNTHTRHMIEQNSGEFWKPIFFPLLDLEARVLQENGLDFGRVLRILARKS
jgi:SAM-dependent methyltransferase